MLVNRRCMKCNEMFRLNDAIVQVLFVNYIGHVKTKATDNLHGRTIFAHVSCPDLEDKVDVITDALPFIEIRDDKNKGVGRWA